MKQEKLVDDGHGPMHFYFHEIQSGGLRKWTFEDEDQIGNILEVISGLERQTNSHSFDQLDLDENTEMCVTNLLDSYPDFIEDPLQPPHQQFLSVIERVWKLASAGYFARTSA